MVRKNKAVSQPHEKHYKHIRTHEDWYPTLTPYQQAPNTNPQFNNTLPYPAVCVMVGHMWKTEALYKVSVWGGDDFGLTKEGMTRTEAFDLFNLIGDFTTQRELKDLGFIAF